jgi:hypothetical protein
MTASHTWIPQSRWFALITGIILATPYFYAGYWLFRGTGLPAAVRILSGLAFSINIIACFYSILNWRPWQIFDIISGVGLVAILIGSLVSRRSDGYRLLLLRALAHIIILVLVVGYRILSVC